MLRKLNRDRLFLVINDHKWPRAVLIELKALIPQAVCRRLEVRRLVTMEWATSGEPHYHNTASTVEPANSTTYTLLCSSQLAIPTINQ